MTNERWAGAAWQLPLGLLLLRFGLGYFLFVWGVTKLLAPAQTVAIWGYFYGVEIDAALPYLMGGGELVLALAILFGVWRVVAYAVGFLVHGVTVVVISGSLLDPFAIEDGFPVNRNASVSLPALTGFALLWLARARDAWSADVWWRRRRAEAARAGDAR